MEFRILGNLSEEERRDVLRIATRRRFRKGEVIFHEGDPGDTFHLLAKGRVAVRVGTPLGEIATLTVLGEGECFGEQALMPGVPRRTATVVALEPVETLVLHGDGFTELRGRHPAVERLLVELLAEQVRRLTELVVDALYVTADRRVLRRLSDIAGTYNDGADVVVVPLTQDELSTMAGTTRQTTNRVLKDAADRGVLTLTRGRIEIQDLDGLRQRAR